MEGDRPDRRTFKTYLIGYFHIDIAQVRTEQGKLYLFVAIDRTAKFAFVALDEKADRPTAVWFLEALIAATSAATSGQKNQTASPSIQSIKCRDKTPNRDERLKRPAQRSSAIEGADCDGCEHGQ